MKDMELKRFKKWKTLISSEFQRQLSFRSDIYFYRLANLVEIVTSIVIWSIIFKTSDFISGYNYKEMMTYITIGWLMIFLTNNYGFEAIVSSHIYDGTLSSFLVKPASYLKYIVTLSIGRTSMALFSGIVMQLLVIFFMHNALMPPSSFVNLLIIILMLALGYLIYLFIAVIVGMISFWTTFINGIRYSINMAVRFLSGRYFPINMLPLVYLKISLLFPFVYVFYMPVQLYMGKISTYQGIKALGAELIWLILLYGIIKIMWKKGLKKYEGVGI